MPRRQPGLKLRSETKNSSSSHSPRARVIKAFSDSQRPAVSVFISVITEVSPTGGLPVTSVFAGKVSS